MSVKTNQSIVNQLVPTLSSDSIDGSTHHYLIYQRCLLENCRSIPKEQKHPDEKTAEWLTEKIQSLYS